MIAPSSVEVEPSKLTDSGASPSAGVRTIRAVGAPLGGVATMVRVAVEVETPSKTVWVTSNVPALNVCVTCAPSAVGLPSPKSQVTVSGSSSGCTEVSRNVTCSGGAPLAGVASKLATGGVSVVCATASASLAMVIEGGRLLAQLGGGVPEELLDRDIDLHRVIGRRRPIRP